MILVCVFGCVLVYVFVPSPALVTSVDHGLSQNALETNFPISLSILVATSRLACHSPGLALSCALSLTGGTRPIKYQNKATFAVPSVIVSATSVLLV